MDDKVKERNCVTLLGKSGTAFTSHYSIYTACLQILAMLGEQFMVGDEICGAVVSIRPNVSHMYVCEYNRHLWAFNL